MTNIIEFLQAHLKVVIWCCLGTLLGIALFSVSIDTSHAHSWVEQHIPAYWSLFGFIAAAIIIFVSHLAAKAGLQVSEDFYERSVIKGEEEEQ
ncbi:hypothetical protein [Desulfogranum japonicum]|uniref:hypothetical protein n=1 Tax=Desulfogranum japonicum TaxID=231447 RepID=UPI000427B747|nr:hypothetical protein [Desulfogranum japonicum]